MSRSKYLSRLFGRVADIPVPPRFRPFIYGAYARLFGVRMAEAEFGFEHYGSLGEFFIRKLKPGVRTLAQCAIVSPVDGRCAEMGVIEEGALIQAKGISYSLVDLVRDVQGAGRLDGGMYATFYLAPGDYHHIHAPVTGKIVRRKYIPGACYPVNSIAVRWIKSLFCVNERVVLDIETEYGLLTLVIVAAYNVGGISLACEHDFREKVRAGTSLPASQTYEPPIPVTIGDLIGTFHMGSTVIVMAEPAVISRLHPFNGSILGRRVFWGDRLC